LNEVTNVGMG